MVAAQIHRGPDDSGETYQPFGSLVLGLGHRRLSIIDISCAGHQPMVHPRTGDQIVFNGEIYNFQLIRQELLSAGEQFAGHSDTEVLLHGLARWGPDYIKRLQGMFAFAFFNAKEQTLLLARDSMGIKPLYVAQAHGTLLFASEVRAILASGLVSDTFDRQGIASLLAYGAVQQPATLFQSIRSFPPGSYQLIKADQIAAPAPAQKFWTIPCQSDQAETRVVQEIEITLEASVRDHLVADVPLGVFLSSGLDSTIIAGLAARYTDQLRSFCVGFADQPDMSESALARETASLFGLRHTDITLNGSEAEQAAMQWLTSLDQPSVDGLNVYIISKAVREHGISVALSGQGGDELFGGYPSFSDIPRLLSLMRQLRRLPTPLRLAFARAASFNKSEAVKEKFKDMVRTSGSILDLYLQRRRIMSDSQLAALGFDQTDARCQGFLPAGALDGIELDGADPIRSISMLESRLYQGNMLLRDSDTNGMAHSLEIRVPMLDQRMLELMFRISGKTRLPDHVANKHLLRKAFAPFLRPALSQQQKRGFTLPIRRWMVGPIRDLCEQALVSLKDVNLFSTRGIDSVWQAFLRDPESQIWSRAFTLCVLGLYIHQMTNRPALPRRSVLSAV